MPRMHDVRYKDDRRHPYGLTCVITTAMFKLNTVKQQQRT